MNVAILNRRQVLDPIRDFLQTCESNKARMYVIVDQLKRASRGRSESQALMPREEYSCRLSEDSSELFLFPLLPVGFRSQSRSMEVSWRTLPSSRAALESSGTDGSEPSELMVEFKQLAWPLKRALSRMRRSYQHLGRDPENLSRLEVRLDDVFSTSSAARSLEVTITCQRLLTELDDLLTSEDLLSLLFDSQEG